MTGSITPESTTAAAVAPPAAPDTTPDVESAAADSEIDFNLFPEDAQDTTPAAPQAQIEEKSSEPPASPAAPKAADKAAEAAEKGEGDVADFVPFKHNHEVRQLSRTAVADIATALGAAEDDVVALLQKGYDYDSKVSKLGETSKAHELITAMADRNGVSYEQAFASVQQALDRAALAKIRETVTTQHPELDDDAVDIIAQQQLELDRKQADEADRQRETEQQTYFENEWKVFWKRHPDAVSSVEDLPESVKRCFENGQTPTEAWLDYQLKQKEEAHTKEVEALKLQLAQSEKKKENQKASIGSVAAEVSSADGDSFLAGLFG